MNKHEVAFIFETIAVLLEAQGENPFKIRAYRNAARTLENLEEDLSIVVEEERLEMLPGIGKDLALKIETLVKTGELEYFEKLKKSVPEGLLELMSIPGLGGKKIKILYDKLKIQTIKDLAEACRLGEIAKLRGFGEKS